jgi:hypothetical protein
MTQAEIIRRGKLTLLVCIGALVFAMALSDWRWGGLMLSSHTRTVLRYAIIVGLGAAALNGAGWARQLLAGLVGIGVLYALYTVAQLGTVLPRLSVWMGAHALINAVVAIVLFLSPSIARYQSSRNELVMP